MTLYEILKAARRKETANTDFMTVLRARSSAMYKGVTTIIKTMTGSLPFTFNSTGANLADLLLSGNMTKTGTPTHENPITPAECGNLVSDNYVLPIVCGGVTTTVYLGEVQTTRQVKKLVLTGDENWSMPYTNIFRLALTGYLRDASNVVICTQYRGIAPVTTVDDMALYDTALLLSASGNNYFYIKDSYAGLDDFKTYLQQQYANGTPVCVWYVLATPTTAVLNEPLRKIGNYADTITMTQAGVSIPTVSGSNTFDVSTTLKPSEATIKYYSADALRQLNITQGSKTKKKSTRKKGT